MWPLEFPYRRCHERQLVAAPMVPVILCHVETGAPVIHTFGLVDTGADTSGIPSAMMAALGLTPAMCSPLGAWDGMDGQVQAFEFPPGVEIVVGDQRTRIAGHFKPESRNVPVLTLGRADFLYAFQAHFDHRTETVRIWPNDDAETCNDDVHGRVWAHARTASMRAC